VLKAETNSVIVAGLLVLACTRARAQVRLGTVEVDAPRSAPDAEAPRPDAEAIPFVTVVDAREPSARVVSVAELLERQAGVQVRSRGGLGSFTSVSLRGSDASEVAVFLDGVPLSREASGIIDLSLVPVDGLDHVEIYRGVPPIELGAEAIGGAINLVTRKGTRRPTVRASAGAGSFGARSATAGYSATQGGLHVDASAAYHGANGDFQYYDNGGTLIDRSDDHVSVRRNNGFDQVGLDVTVGGGRRLRWDLGAHGFWKHQGVPGLGSSGAETVNARFTSAHVLLDGGVARTGRWADLRVQTSLQYDRASFSNPTGEQVGTFGANVSDSESIAAGVSARADVPWGTHQLVTALSEVRAEYRRPYDLLRPDRSGSSASRGIGAVALSDEVRLWRDRLALTPAVRLDGHAASTITDGSGAPIPQQETSSVFVSPRLSVRLQVCSWLTLRGSAGRFVRFPTLLEQFGDGAFLLAQPSLRPETSWGGDVGASVAVRRPAGSLTLELVLFGRQVSDYIAFLPTAYAVSAFNIGDTRVLGAELRAAAQVGRWLTLSADYTLLDAVNFTDEPGVRGKQLPGRPAHQVGGRVELTGGPFRAFYDVQFVDDVYRDAQNYNRIPGRTLHAIGASVEHRPFTFSVEVRNLADLRVLDLPLGGSANRGLTTPYPLVDFFDYPLPGRAIYATLALRH
jgi:iron complex outermembrane receptor protein